MPVRPHSVLLRADNFTPLTRTPWAGTRLREFYKPDSAVSAARLEQARVGESWEVSVEPDFPAQLADADQTLAQWLEQHGSQALGQEAARGRASTALLVKLLDTAAPLSLQIHPDDSYPGLEAGESGKPESWYIAHADAGAGLYLGFADGVTRAQVEEALDGKAPVLPLLRFVPVREGDFFVIDAGTPHAIGAGLTLVEPQHVAPGRRGLTYRYWDWERTYDEHGSQSAQGEPRALHRQQALEVTRWDDVCEEAFVGRIRNRAGAADTGQAAEVLALCGPESAIPSQHLQVWRACGTGRCPAPSLPLLRSLTVLSGSVEIHDSGHSLHVEAGRSAVIPACATSASLVLNGAHAVLASVV